MAADVTQIQVLDADGPAWEDLMQEVLTDDPEAAGLEFIQAIAPGESAPMLYGGCTPPCSSCTPSSSCSHAYSLTTDTVE